MNETDGVRIVPYSIDGNECPDIGIPEAAVLRRAHATSLFNRETKSLILRSAHRCHPTGTQEFLKPSRWDASSHAQRSRKSKANAMCHPSRSEARQDVHPLERSDILRIMSVWRRMDVVEAAAERSRSTSFGRFPRNLGSPRSCAGPPWRIRGLERTSGTWTTLRPFAALPQVTASKRAKPCAERARGAVKNEKNPFDQMWKNH